MNPLDYFISYYGNSPWKDIVLAWGGTGTNWKLYQVNNPTPLYQGANYTYPITSTPNTRGDYRLETTVGGTTYSQTIMTYTSSLPAPIGLAAGSITSTTASLSWTAVTGATAYEIADVAQSYKVLDTLSPTTQSLTGLTPSTRYSRAVRTVYGDIRSPWSAPVTFFTSASTSVTPGTYNFGPSNIYTWSAGKAGSTDPTWLSSTSDWYAGEGSAWGDNRGVMTTYFFFGSPNPFVALSGGTVTRFQVYLDRNGPTGDPGVVLSQWGLHNYTDKPGSQPLAPTATTDVGQFARNAYGWVDLPTSMGQTLITGTYACGLAWGGTPERYQSSLYADITVSPRVGDLKITVS